MKVFAIIVAYNGSQWIGKCLSSLRNSSQIIHSIVVDNASTDETAEIIKKEYSEVELIQSDKNLGFGQANNIGLQRALEDGVDYVLLLNQDAWVENNTIEKLIDVAKRNSQFGILSPYHLNYEGTDTERYFEDWVVGHYTPGLKVDRDKGDMKDLYESTFVHAACWLMPISTIETVGGFDPLFFHYDEDVDYVNRSRFKGIKVGICSNIKVCHFGTNEGLNNSTDNYNIILNSSVLQLKNFRASLIGSIALFLRQFFKVLVSPKKSSTYKKAYLRNLIRIGSIIKSRNEQRVHLAYLK